MGLSLSAGSRFDHVNMSAKAGALACLPDELLVLVLKRAARLCQKHCLCVTFPLVCKRFRQLGPTLCTDIQLASLPASQFKQFAQWLRKHGPQIKEISLPAAALEEPNLIFDLRHQLCVWRALWARAASRNCPF